VVSLSVLRAACPYCLVSAAVEALILADVIRWWRAVPGLRAIAPLPRAPLVGGGAAALAVLLALGAFAVSPAGATLYQVALARHLSSTRAVMYGAYWCPHCQEQKEMFSEAAAMLPYVECDPRGSGARPDLCEQASVKSFPTWVIGDQRLAGTQSLDALARASHFPGGRGAQ
jgi:glutaredoxin